MDCDGLTVLSSSLLMPLWLYGFNGDAVFTRIRVRVDRGLEMMKRVPNKVWFTKGLARSGVRQFTFWQTPQAPQPTASMLATCTKVPHIKRQTNGKVFFSIQFLWTGCTSGIWFYGENGVVHLTTVCGSTSPVGLSLIGSKWGGRCAASAF